MGQASGALQSGSDLSPIAAASVAAVIAYGLVLVDDEFSVA
jgi:hypothetical protein